jgi:DNA-binding protein HU-beta
MANGTAAGKKRMTQSDVFNHFAERTGMKRAQVKQFFEDLASLATSEVKNNGEFVLPGFGKLVRSERKAREGRNPATGETIQIPAKTTLKFRVGKSMKDSVLPKK